ncbi:bile acid:sodium symporter family protein [Ahrensia sp. R2A130]|uniref:bile acid:sodium symporter family protein n=1 Tax=Ahrensia sp. R2A130 TaxID=744979 RepID=UPI0001E0A485|nr:bile acid:sodium symporter family protein [Ahrensia sp. R2A130]EFL88612.1 sodium dependent transporter [Ahrensia sp. R2A130]
MGLLISVGLPLALAIIMLTLGLGLTLADFKRVAIRPKAFGVGFIAQVIVVPIAAFGIAQLAGLSPELSVGLMILSLCPGGVTSNMMSKIARGDVALSVSLTAVVSLITIFTVPFAIAFSVDHFMGSSAPPVDVTSIAISMFLITAVPVLIGVAVRHFAPGFVANVETVATRFSFILFVVIVVAALATNWTLFISQLPKLGPAVISLNIVLIITGFVLALVLGLSPQERRTIAIEAGVQNSTVGITLGAILAGSGAAGFSAFALPAAAYGLTMYVVTLPVVAWFRHASRGEALNDG